METEMKVFKETMKQKIKKMITIENIKNKKEKIRREESSRKLEEDRKKMIKDLSCYKIKKLKF